MKKVVYLAFMVIDYEGVYQPSMKVFSTKEKAEKHEDKLRKEHGTSGQRFEIIEFEIDGEQIG